MASRAAANCLQACDNVLKSVEISLTSFQKDLGHVSAEIETLQNRSATLNTRLENRKVVEKLLGPAVEEVSISPTIMKIISDGPIDENWSKALADLERRLKVVDSKLKGSDTIKAVTDVKPLLDNLTGKVGNKDSSVLLGRYIKTFLGSRENTRLPRSAGEVVTVPQYQCSDYTAANATEV